MKFDYVRYDGTPATCDIGFTAGWVVPPALRGPRAGWR